jgi:hypothetical protein
MRSSARQRVPLAAFATTVACIVVLVAGAVIPAAAHATAGTYTVTATSTNAAAFPGWWNTAVGGHFQASDMVVSTGAGSYAAWSSRRWRIELPSSLTLAGGLVRGTSATPTDGMAAVVRTGSGGGAVRTLYTGSAGGAFTVALPARNQWVDFGLQAQKAASLTAAGTNLVHVSSVKLIIDDAAPPSVVLTAQPNPARWLGPADCASWGYQAVDLGGGVVSGSGSNVTTGAAFGAWTQPSLPGLRPGLTKVKRNGCLPASAAQHGTNVLRLRVMDASGRFTDELLRARFDLTAPSASGGPDDGSTIDTPSPTERFEVGDADSGIASVTATWDAVAAPLTRDGSHVVVTSAATLGVGDHVLTMQVTDAVGNVTVVTRHVHVVDDTPPAITVTSPGATGGTQPWLQATAADVGSGIDPAGWAVLVDGVPVSVVPAGDGISGSLGTLTAGAHVLKISAADAAGNVAHTELAYVAVGPAPAPGSADDGAPPPAVGSASGIFVVSTPRAALGMGSVGTYRVLAAANGRPLVGYRVRLARTGITLASALTDAQGVAMLTWTATAPGAAQFVVDGAQLAPLGITLAVAPRLTISVHNTRPRAGHPVTVAGRLLPHLRGRKVHLLARVGGSWFPVRSLAVTASGRFSAKVTAAVRGKVAVRAQILAGGGWSAAQSNIVTLHVR